MLAFDLAQGSQPLIQADICPTPSGTANVGSLHMHGTVYFVDGPGSPSLGIATEWVSIYQSSIGPMGVGSFIPTSGGTPNTFDVPLYNGTGDYQVNYVGLSFVINSGWFGTVFIDQISIHY